MLDRPRRMKCFNLLLFNDLHRDTWQYRQYYIEWNLSNEFIIRGIVVSVSRGFHHWEIKKQNEKTDNIQYSMIIIFISLQIIQ